MRLCYQVATPDVAIADSVTAYQGDLEDSFRTLSALGYQGVEFMTLHPVKLDWEAIKELEREYSLKVALVCTGEIFGQLRLSYADRNPTIRKEAVQRTQEIIDFASVLSAKINIGRIRGSYQPGISVEQTEEWAIEAFQEISDYAAKKNVAIALETVTIMQTNFINTLSDAVRIIKRVDRPNFQLMMDVFHMNIEEKDLLEAIRTYSRYNIHVHLSDNNRRYPGNCGMDFEAVLQAFHDCGYDGDYTTEIFQLPSQEVAAERAAKHLLPILQKIYGGSV